MDITIEKLKSIFKKEVDARVDVENMDPDQPIMDQGVDSLDRSSVFLEIEDEFGVNLDDNQIEQLDTLNKILDFIKKENQ